MATRTIKTSATDKAPHFGASAEFGSFGKKKEEKSGDFQTSRSGPVRLSIPHTIISGTFDSTMREIQVFSEDGRIHRCKVDRLPDAEAGRTLWKKLVAAQKKGLEIRFKAAGGFSPETWFFDIVDSQ
jgi:hypothetical protein